ncbi:PREDICTED: prostaglandin D2 receptor [Aptenodytes forsteri]|uniref:prostaglandin D2 receptor n=1 Tax=Aptenodytes forsteri TaxID=9233 RepID=UPI0004F4572E|nr:PREDICTED: prostaglandin D2 receptor [Aptenodytes forsteri]
MESGNTRLRQELRGFSYNAKRDAALKELQLQNNSSVDAAPRVIVLTPSRSVSEQNLAGSGHGGDASSSPKCRWEEVAAAPGPPAPHGLNRALPTAFGRFPGWPRTILSSGRALRGNPFLLNLAFWLCLAGWCLSRDIPAAVGKPSALVSSPSEETGSGVPFAGGGLAVTDLLGKCLLSPIVLAAYAYNRSLSELGPGGRTEGGPGVLCQLFAFLMAFFGLAPTLLLLAMALECWLSLGHPYFYRRHLTRRLGATLGPVVAGLCALFCALPLLGFGVPMQYCPGTWCFIRMAGGGPRQLSFPVLYASLMGLLVLAIGACNVSSMRHLYRMARRQPHPPPAVTHYEQSWCRSRGYPKIRIRVYMGAFAADFNENADLSALRFLSVNSIVDPWVFIIFRTSVFRMFVRRVCRKLNSRKASLKGPGPGGDGQFCPLGWRRTDAPQLGFP